MISSLSTKNIIEQSIYDFPNVHQIERKIIIYVNVMKNVHPEVVFKLKTFFLLAKQAEPLFIMQKEINREG